jgi:hypothetical protein
MLGHMGQYIICPGRMPAGSAAMALVRFTKDFAEYVVQVKANLRGAEAIQQKPRRPCYWPNPDEAEALLKS